jgi:hypothetical protein
MPYLGNGLTKFTTADDLTVSGDAAIDTTTLVVDSTNNRVGIGNASPATALDVTGVITTDGMTTSADINFGDNDKAVFGASSDLQISHNGSYSLIADSGTGNLILACEDFSLTNPAVGENMITAAVDGAVTLYHDNSAKLATTSTGVSVTGSLGIGTSAPAHNVEIVVTAAGSVNDSLQIRNNATSSGTGSRIRFINSTDNTSDTNGASISSVRNGDDNDLVFETENTERVRIDHAGVAVFSHSVGIGTSIPDSSLTIATSSSGEFNALSIRQANNTSGNESRITFTRTTDAGSDREVAAIVADRVGGNDTALVFETNTDGSDGATERVRINHDGNLLIGKTADNVGTVGIEARGTGPLISTRDGSDALRLNRLNSDGEIIQLRKDGSTVGSIGTIGGDMVAGTGDTGLRFHDGADQVYPSNTNGSGRDAAIDLGNSGARFKDGYFAGNIRTDSTLFAPSFTCYPNGSAPTADAAIYRPQDGTLGFVSNGSEKARFASDGNLYIAKTSDTATGVGLTLSGGGFIRAVRNEICGVFNRQGSDGTLLSFARSNSGVGAISVTTSATTYSTSSDRRLKSNIQDAASASSKIDAIQVRQFDWNADNSHQDYGLIAQELEPIEPMAVSGSADSDEMMGVDYSKLVPMLLKEIQELRSRVAALEE